MDASVNGTLLFKSYNEAYEILERIANSNHHWAGVHNVDALTVLSTQVTSLSNIVKTIITTSATLTKLLRYLVFIIERAFIRQWSWKSCFSQLCGHLQQTELQ